MRAALGAAIVVLVTACGSTQPPCSSCTGPFVGDLLISRQGAVVQMGLFQTAVVQIPGSNRSLTPSLADRVLAERLAVEPDGSSLLTVLPMAGWIGGKSQHFGGTVNLAATTGFLQSPWNVTVQIATDPLSGHDQHTYLGSGTTVMQIGQTFVMNWPVGSAPPTSTNTAVLRPLADPVELVTQPFGVGTSTRYMQELFVGVAAGQALLNAPTAFDPKTGEKFGPSQRFIVNDNRHWTCSPAGGCFTPVASEDNWRPDHYYPPGVTTLPVGTPRP